MQNTFSRAVFVKSPRAQAALFILLILGLFSTIPAGASSEKPSKVSGVKIENFGQVDEYLYRGGQPAENDFHDLAALGIKTVVNLRDDPKGYEMRATEAAGMHYLNIPMSSSRTPNDEQIEQFLKVVDDPASRPVFVHCAGGRHRTGVAVAVYRLTHYGWNIDQAYSEMKAYDFYTRWGHGAMKDYVFNYYRGMHRTQASSGSTPEQSVQSQQN